MDDQTSGNLPEKPSHIITVTKDQERTRLDKFLTSQIANITRSQLQKLISDNAVLVDGKPVKPSYLVNAGEIVSVFAANKPNDNLVKENIPLDIIYEDDHVLVINKPAGLVVHPAHGNMTGTLVNALLYRYDSIDTVGEADRPGIVHRLDKDTSGLLVVAKNAFAHQHLAHQFKERTISREYHAVVWGRLKEQSKRIVGHISRSTKDRTRMISTKNRGKEAITNYLLIKQYSLAAHICVKLETGRTHQIRVHLLNDGHPVVGDPTYSGRNKQVVGLNYTERLYARGMLECISRQALHAKKIGFTHPVTGKFLEFDSALPEDMQKLLGYLDDLENSF